MSLIRRFDIRDLSPMAVTYINENFKSLWQALGGNIDNIKTHEERIVKIKEVTQITAEQLDVEKARIDHVIATAASIDELNATRAYIDDLIATTATITQLNTEKARIDEIIATMATIEELNAQKARIDNIIANYVTTTDLGAERARITDLEANTATIVQLDAERARIRTLEGNVASINSILSKDIFTELAEVGRIIAGSAIIADGAIGNAQISDMDVSKLNAGIIDTAKFTVQGPNGRLKISNNLLQIFDGTTTLFERIALGDLNKDGTRYGFVIRGTDGTTVLLDENGLTDIGFTDGYNKLADNSLDPAKIDIAQAVTRINEGTTTINSNKVLLTDKTLDIAFGEMNNTITDQGETISQNTANITTLNNQIALKVDGQTFEQYKTTTDGVISTIDTQLQKNTGSISVLQDEIALKVSQVEVDKSIGNIKTGVRNYIRNFNSGEWYISDNAETVNNYELVLNATKAWDFSQIILPIEPSTTYTFSINKGTIGRYVSIYENETNLITAIDDDKEPVVTFTTSPEAYNLDIRLENYDIGEFVFKDIMLGKGNVATGWTPAPEDKADINEVGSALDGKADKEELVNLDTKISENTSIIQQHSDEIALKVSRKDLMVRNIWGINLISNEPSDWAQDPNGVGDNGQLGIVLGYSIPLNGGSTYIMSIGDIDVSTFSYRLYCYLYDIEHYSLSTDGDIQDSISPAYVIDAGYTGSLGAYPGDLPYKFTVPGNAYSMEIKLHLVTTFPEGSVGELAFDLTPEDIVGKELKLEEGEGATPYFPSLYGVGKTPFFDGTIESEEAPDNPIIDDLWLNTSNAELNVWDGTQWVVVGLGALEDIVKRVSSSEAKLQLLENSFNVEISSLKDNQEMINGYMNYDGDRLKLGKTNNPLNLTISNEQINFIDNGQIVAYINGQKQYIKSLEVLEDLIIGVHKIEKYEGNDSLTLVKWVGEN